jgi:hypothetical protein
MKLQLLVAALLVVALTIVNATQVQNPPFTADRTITLSNNTNSGDNTVVSGLQKTGCIWPCDVDYYLLTVRDVSVGDYLYININFTSTAPRDFGALYVKYHNPALPIIPFSFPDEHNYDRFGFVNTVVPGVVSRSIDMEITCHFKSGNYILGITGGATDRLCYNMTIFRRFSPVQSLFVGFPFSVFNETRAIEAPWLTTGVYTHYPPYNTPRHYRFFRVSWPRTNFREGTFMVATLSRVQVDASQRPVLRALYGGLPQAFPTDTTGRPFESGVPKPNDLSPPCLSWPNRQCTDLLGNFVDCECTPVLTPIPNMVGMPRDRFEFACNVTISPCRWQYGDWYLSVWYPPRIRQFYPGYVNYTIQADIYAPRLTPIERNVTYKGFVDPQLMSHYRVLVPFSDVVNCDHHFHVHLNNVRGGTVALYVHQSPGQLDPTEALPGTNLAGDPRGFGREACLPAEYECRTCSACNLIVPKCRFKANYWYIGLAVVSIDTSNLDRLPISYTIRANWVTDPPPRRLLAGKPVSRFIGENLYDFYMIDLPETIDTWLFVELFARCEQDEVVVYMKHGELPGEDCYANPDFWCVTGPGQESCSFMINVCEMEPGPLYITVFGLNSDDLTHTWLGREQATTYYEVPVEYTLWADFDVAMQVESGVSYTHCVHPEQYAHYYIRADHVSEGSYMSVETTAKTVGGMQTYVNYNFLAGKAPCYDHLFNHTSDLAAEPCSDGEENDIRYNQATGLLKRPWLSTDTYSVIVVSHCDFRSGVWYISVKGQDRATGNTGADPSGQCQCFVLTATVWDAPKVKPLVIGETITGCVERFTRHHTTYQYDHYKLASQTMGRADLRIQLTYVQNGAAPGVITSFEGGHGGADDQLMLIANRENLATVNCWRFVETASTASCSNAQIVIPHCQWYNFQWWVSVRSNTAQCTDCGSCARYTLRTSVHSVDAENLHDSVAVVKAVQPRSYDHFYFECAPGWYEGEYQYLNVDFYTNQRDGSTPPLTLYMAYDCMAGEQPCYKYAQKATGCSVSWQFEAAEIRQYGKYYFSVYNSGENQPAPGKCGCAVDYSLTVGLKRNCVPITLGNPGTGHIHAPVVAGNTFNRYRHSYKVNIASVTPGQALVFEVSNVQHGSVIAYINHGSCAGPCPNYSHLGFCRAVAQPSDCSNINAPTQLFTSSAFRNWCEVRIPYCVLKSHTGDWYFTVEGIENLTPGNLKTSIGYTYEANLETPEIQNYDRFLVIFPVAPAQSIFNEQQVGNSLWKHYAIRYQSAYVNHHLTVEVTNIKYGTVDVLFSQGDPADLGDFWNPEPWWSIQNSLTPHASHGCAVGYSVFPWGTCGPIHDFNFGYCGETHHTPCFLCRNDRQVNAEGCLAEVPYCLFQVATPDQYYISVTGNTAHAWTEFSFAAYLRPPVTLNADTEFNSTSIAQHFKGYSQFYILSDVTTEAAPSGQILEVFFYRIRNLKPETLVTNPMSQSDFYVWLNPRSAAGPHKCLNRNVNWATRGISSRDIESVDNHGWCVDHVTQWSRINVAEQWKNVTVWNCVLRQANGGAATNPWFMTVDPYTSQLLRGFTIVRVNYSVRWRVRDTAGTPLSLNNFTNIADAPLANTPPFTMNMKESYRVFFVDVDFGGAADPRWKLVIQTIFTSTVGVNNFFDSARVYIQHGDIANPGPCNEYSCSWPSPNNQLDCAGNWRYQRPSCNLLEGTYYITVRQYDHQPISFRFRNRIIKEARPTIDIKANPQICTNSTNLTNGTIVHVPCVWRFNVQNGALNNASGVEGENYHHYRLDIAEDDIADHQSLIVNLTNTFLINNNVNTASGLLYSFVRKGYEAGAFRYLAGGLAESQKDDHLSDFCYSFRYACSVNAATQGTNRFCVIQIPYCQLEAGSWYISVYNPDLNLASNNDTTAYRGYTLDVGFMQVADLKLGVSYNITQVARTPGAYYHHRVEVTEADLSDYFDKYFVVRLYDVTAAGVSLYVRKGDLAGHHNMLGYKSQGDIDSWNAKGQDDQFCLDRNQQVENCQVGNNVVGTGIGCSLFFVPCGGLITKGYEPIDAGINPQILPHRSRPREDATHPHAENKLTPGVYYISVWVPDIASYKLKASMEWFDLVTRGTHKVLDGPTTVAGKDHRDTTTNYVWRTPDIDTKNLNITRPTLQWWQVNLSSAAATVNGRNYVHIQLEDVALNNLATAWVRMDVFRNDCASWYSCDAGNNGTLPDITPDSRFRNCFLNQAQQTQPPGTTFGTEIADGSVNALHANQCVLPAVATGTSANGQYGWCHIDAVGNGPCQLAKTASTHDQYRIRIWNPLRANYTVRVWLNQTTETALTNGQNYSSVLYRWQYEHFTYTHDHANNNECTMRIDLYAYCGSVEGCVNRGRTAGVWNGQELNEKFQSWGIPGQSTPGGILYDVGHTESNCHMACCQTDFTRLNRIENPVGSNLPEDSHCQMFLDTCVFHPGQYSIVIRGVSQEFPTFNNRRLHFPAKYVVTPTVICRQATEIKWMGCDTTVTWTSACRHDDSIRFGINWHPQMIGEECKDTAFKPRQYFIDYETWSVGTWLRFQLDIPANSRRGEMILSHNRTVSYTGAIGGCPNYGSCRASAGDKCCILVPMHRITSGRWYIWANAVRGSVIKVERWVPNVQFIVPNWPYSASIDAAAPCTSSPFTMPLQCYRMILDGENTPDSDSFWLRAKLTKVQNGRVTLHINDGLEPYVAGSAAIPDGERNSRNSYWTAPYAARCTAAGSTGQPDGECTAGYQPCGVQYDLRNQWSFCVEGVSQECPKHTIKYTIEIKTKVEESQIFSWKRTSRSISNGDMHHYKVCGERTNDPVVITPNGNDLPTIERNHTILSMFVKVDDPTSTTNTNPLNVYMRQGKIALQGTGCSDESFSVDRCTQSYYTDADDANIAGSGRASNAPFFWRADYWNPLVVPQTRWNAYERICQYNDLRVTVQANADVDYCIEYRLHTIQLNPLADAVPFDSESIHPHLCGSRDFFLFNVPDNTNVGDSYLWTKLNSLGSAELWVNYGSLADGPCHVANCATRDIYDFIKSRDTSQKYPTTDINQSAGRIGGFSDDLENPLLRESCYAHVICNFQTGDYYMTVVAKETYTLEARIVKTTTEVVLGARSSELSVAPGEYKYFKIDVPQPQIDQYLQVDIADVHSGGLMAAIRYARKPAPDFSLNRVVPSCYEGVEDPVVVDWDRRTPGYSGSILGDPQQAYVDSAYVKTHGTIRYSHCALDAGTYYVMIYGLDDFHYLKTELANGQQTYFKLHPRLINYGVTPFTLNLPVGKQDSQLGSGNTDWFRADGTINDKYSFAVVRLHDVQGGRLFMRAKRNYLASPGMTWGGECKDWNGVQPPRACDPLNPAPRKYYECSTEDVITTAGSYVHINRADLNDYSLDFLSSNSSCGFVIDTCDWAPTSLETVSWYFSVTASKTDYIQAGSGWLDVPITYSITVEEKRDWDELWLDYDRDVKEGSFTNDNWDYHQYKATTGNVRGLRFRFVVTGGEEGIYVNVRDHECDQHAQWQVNLWCDRDYNRASPYKTNNGKSASDDVICEVEVPTRASHPFTSLTYYITVNGRDATYRLSWHQGWMETCDVPHDLEFCSGIVDYPVWIEHDAFQLPAAGEYENVPSQNLTDWSRLDAEARCKFNDMFAKFVAADDYRGVTPECNATLRRFACYESFKRCDNDGFSVGTCRIACESVCYFCATRFDTLELGHFQCSSDRYLDHVSEHCTGHREEIIFPQGAFPKTPGLTLLESSASTALPGLLVMLSLMLLQLLL